VEAVEEAVAGRALSLARAARRDAPGIFSQGRHVSDAFRLLTGYGVSW